METSGGGRNTPPHLDTINVRRKMWGGGELLSDFVPSETSEQETPGVVDISRDWPDRSALHGATSVSGFMKNLLDFR